MTTTVFATEPVEEYSLRGRVLNENGEPLPGATVVVQGTTIGSGTNTKGEFVLKLRARHEVRLYVSFVGYLPKEVTVNPESYASEPVTVVLQPGRNELLEVVVTGTPFAKPLKETPVLTRVINQENIRALNPGSIENLLQYELPGLQIGYNSMSRQPFMTYQGVNADYVLFLIDGERVSGEGASANVDFTRFNVNDIERIEVVKGAQSTVYGSNALGGVINIITKKNNRPFSGEVSSRLAGIYGNTYSASVGMDKGKLSAFTSASFRDRKTYSVKDKGGKPVTTLVPGGATVSIPGEAVTNTIYGGKIWNLTQKVGYVVNDRLSTEFKATYYHNKHDLRANQVFRNLFSDYTLGGKLKYLPSGNQEWGLSYLFDNYKKDKHYYMIDKTRTDYRNRTQTAKLTYTYRGQSHTLSLGGEYNHEYLKHYMLKDSADASAGMLALYAQEDWEIMENLSLIMGVRADYHRKYRWNLTPKLSLMYRPFDFLTLRLGYARGFRSPSLKELYQAYDMGGLGAFMIYGNPRLKPERSRQYSASLEGTFGSFNCSVSAYDYRFSNQIKLMRTGNKDDLGYVNADRAHTHGVEFLGRWIVARWLTLNGTYAYVNDFQEVEGKNTSLTRPHSITFGANYHQMLGKVKASISLNGQWASRLTTYAWDNERNLESRTYNPRLMCTLNLGARFPRGISAVLGVDNLFNYQDQASDSYLQLPQKGISLVGTVSINLADLLAL